MHGANMSEHVIAGEAQSNSNTTQTLSCTGLVGQRAGSKIQQKRMWAGKLSKLAFATAGAHATYATGFAYHCKIIVGSVAAGR